MKALLGQYFRYWRRKWQTTPVFLPGEFHEQQSLVGYSSRGHKESEMTERPTHFRHTVNVKRVTETGVQIETTATNK